MIDIENYVFNNISKELRNKFQNIFVKSEYVKNISDFPCVFINEKTNTVLQETSDEVIENHANLMYQVDIFSNLTSSKKAECKKILKVVDEKMSEMGFVRILCEPIENLEDATIYRITARYNAIVGRKINGINQIYRNQ